MSFKTILGQNIIILLCISLCWHQFIGLQFMTVSLSKLCRKTFAKQDQLQAVLYSRQQRTHSTNIQLNNSFLLTSKPEARCEFPLLSQCQPGLSPHTNPTRSAETQQQVRQEMLTDCKAQLTGCWR